jgi:RNA polymerase sigma-70 factor (ECF subfamily)
VNDHVEQVLFDFDEFFLMHYDRLYNMLYRIVGTQQEAEDLAQEAFLRFHQHFASIYEDKRKAWLYRVAVNLGYTAIQSRKRKSQWAKQQAKIAQELQKEPKHHSESRMDIQDVLAALPGRQAKLLTLYASGLSYDELAEAVGIKPSSVSQLLVRAKRAFKTQYDQQNG